MIIEAEDAPAAPSCIVAANAYGLVLGVYGNPSPVLGWQREDVLGRDMVETFIPEHYRKAHLAGLARFRENPAQEFRVFGRVLAVEAIGADGLYRSVSLNVFEYDATEGKFYAVITRKPEETP